MPRSCWRATRSRATPSPCTSRANRPGRSRPCASSSARIGSARVAHPHLLGVYDARTLEGRAVAVAQAPPGRRLDELLADGPIGAGAATRIARQVASAVDALEEAGAEPPPLTPERIWVDGAGDAHLDGLDARIGLVTLAPAASSSAALARMVADMTARVPRRLNLALDRARDGAYLSAGQFAADLRAVEAVAERRRRETSRSRSRLLAARARAPMSAAADRLR